MTDTDLLYGAQAIADFLGMRTTQVYPLIHKGKLPVLKIGARVACRKSTLTNWLESKEVAA
jgi:excisionase family DNA binding protein